MRSQLDTTSQNGRCGPNDVPNDEIPPSICRVCGTGLGGENICIDCSITEWFKGV